MGSGIRRAAKRKRAAAIKWAALFAFLIILECLALFLVRRDSFELLIAASLCILIGLFLFELWMASYQGDTLVIQDGVLIHRQGAHAERLILTEIRKCKHHYMAFPGSLRKAREIAGKDYRPFGRRLTEISQVAIIPRSAVLLRPMFPLAYWPAIATLSTIGASLLFMLCCRDHSMPLTLLPTGGLFLLIGGALLICLFQKSPVYALDASGSSDWATLIRKLYPAVASLRYKRIRRSSYARYRALVMEGYLELHFSDGSRLIVDDRFAAVIGRTAGDRDKTDDIPAESHSAVAPALPSHPI